MIARHHDWFKAGEAGRGRAGMARLGGARRGMAGRGVARLGMAGFFFIARQESLMKTVPKSSRHDGRTKTEVIIGLVKDAEPGEVFTYEQVMAALDDGDAVRHDLRSTQAAVRTANRRFLKDHQRCLVTIATVGYRIAHAREHKDVAEIRINRAKKQRKWAIQTLENARMSEMTEQERATTIALLQINQQVHAQERRLRRQEEKMASISKIVAGLQAERVAKADA